MWSGNVKLLFGEHKKYGIDLDGCEELDKLYEKNPEHIVHVTIEKAVKPGSDEQNRAMHSLLQELWMFLMKNSNNPIMDFTVFKEYMKLQFNFVYYFEKDGKTVAVPMRWSRMNKLQRSEFMEKLISYINELDGCNQFGKIQEILKGMENNLLKA